MPTPQVQTGLESGGLPGNGSRAAEYAALGASIGTAILPGVGTVIGTALGALAGILGIKGRTPRLSWEERDAIAKPVEKAVFEQLRAFKIDPDSTEFRSLLDLYGVRFIQSVNPGESGIRARYISEMTGYTTQKFWRILMYALEGCAVAQDSPTNAKQRCEEAVEKVIVPAVTDYAKAKNLPTDVIDAEKVTITPAPATSSGGGPDAWSSIMPEKAVWIIAAVVLALAVIVFVKG
jgi:hypothetical protein